VASVVVAAGVSAAGVASVAGFGPQAAISGSSRDSIRTWRDFIA